jgi:hypothetical protein
MRTAVVRSGVGETINLGSGLGGAALFASIYGTASLRTTPPSDQAVDIATHITKEVTAPG